jgi:hypothetical protein
MKIAFLERGGIGDLLFRIPYYDHFLDNDSVLLCSKRDREVLDFFLPGRNIISFSADWFLLDPLYRRRVLKMAGAPFEKAVLCTPYYHEKMLRVCEKLPAEKKIAFWEYGKGADKDAASSGFLVEQARSPAHYSETVISLFVHAGCFFPEQRAPYLFFREWRKKERWKSADRKGNAPYVVFQPDAGVLGKKWPEGNWKTLAGYIPSPYTISIVGELSLDLSVANTQKRRVLGIQSAFREILGASLFVGNDTGFTHFAYLCGIPTVFIAGGGEEGRFCPWTEYNESYGHTVEWVFNRMDCFGCGWDCVYGDYRRITPPCVENISVREVLHAMKKLEEKGKSFVDEALQCRR